MSIICLRTVDFPDSPANEMNCHLKKATLREAAISYLQVEEAVLNDLLALRLLFASWLASFRCARHQS